MDHEILVINYYCYFIIIGVVVFVVLVIITNAIFEVVIYFF
jgi:hypothetical protein